MTCSAHSDSTDGKDGAPLERLDQGICGKDNWGGLSGGGASRFAGTAAASNQRAALVARYFIAQGYNTNYAAGWHLVRSAPRVGRDTSSPPNLVTNGDVAGQGIKGLNSTLGPLKRRTLETGKVNSSQIPFLADGAPGDIDEAILATNLRFGPLLNDGATPDPFAVKNESKDYISQGELLTEAFNDGPAYWNGSNIDLIPAVGALLSDQIATENSGVIPAPLGPSGSVQTYLQDTRDWFAVHGGGKTPNCNILMADGSVKSFNDLNGDRFLNPGFPVPDDLSDAQYAGIGYRDSNVELPVTDIFSGVFLQNLLKGKFE